MTLTTLLPRLEAGEASRELDALLEVMAQGAEAARAGLVSKRWATWKWSAARSGHVSDGHTTYAADRFTQSLDAALALAERVLPGWAPGVEKIGDLWLGKILDPAVKSGVAGAHHWSPAPALALVAAIVKAKLGEVG